VLLARGCGLTEAAASLQQPPASQPHRNHTGLVARSPRTHPFPLPAPPQVKDLLKPYGQLKSFNLVMDKATGKSKGYCFCEFDDEAAIDGVIAGLHMKNLNRKLLTVKRALDGLPPTRSYSGGSEGGSGGMGSRRNSGGALLGAQQGGFARSGSGGSGGGLYGLPPGGMQQHHHPGNMHYMGLPGQTPMHGGMPGPQPGWRGNALPPQPQMGMGGPGGPVFGLGPPPPGAGGPHGPDGNGNGSSTGGPRPAPIQPPPVLKKASSTGSGGAPGAAEVPVAAGTAVAAAGAAAAPPGNNHEAEDEEAVGGPLPAIASLPGGVVSAVAW